MTIKTETSYHSVIALSTSPSDPRGPVIVLRGTPEACLRHYLRLCEEGPEEHEGRALVLVDGDGRPLYAAS